jgi:HlyD family secretion protein
MRPRLGDVAQEENSLYYRNMSIFSYIRKHSFLAGIAFVLLVILAIFAGRSGENEAISSNSSIKKVSVTNVAVFREGSDFVFANGLVVSRGQVDLKSQTSAPVASIYGAIGDSVSAGDVILELENADTRAGLEQARASLALASGQYFTGGVSLESAKSGALKAIQDAYDKGYEAIFTKIDPLLFNYDGNGSRLSSLIIDSAINNRITMTRVDLNYSLNKWKESIQSINESSSEQSVLSLIKLSIKNLNDVESFLSDINEAMNDSTRYASGSFYTLLNSWNATVSGIRSTISGANSALIASESALSSASASYGMTASAGVSVAKAGVNNLEAQLAKTIIRSPISGKIAGLPLSVGELASPGQLLASVVGEQGLEIKAYASGEDINRIKVGSKVTIGSNSGVVESVAPSVNSANRKVEVKIAVDDKSIATTSKDSLVIGQNVSVLIQADKGSTIAQDNLVYKLPIQNVKIVPGDAYVFTVDGSVIKKNQVILGEVEGDFIKIVGGLSDNMDIVTPVYELDEGEEVVVE